MDLEFNMYRYDSGNDSTLGKMFDPLDNGLCYTCEDEHRDVKVMHETRIPAGRYEIKLRKAGSIHPRYQQKFPEIHKGMLWLQDVPEFEWIYIHLGNTDDHSSGCILTGSQPLPDEENGGGRVADSTSAYLKVYPMMANAIEDGHRVFLTVHDNDHPDGKSID